MRGREKAPKHSMLAWSPDGLLRGSLSGGASFALPVARTTVYHEQPASWPEKPLKMSTMTSQVERSEYAREQSNRLAVEQAKRLVARLKEETKTRCCSDWYGPSACA